MVLNARSDGFPIVSAQALRATGPAKKTLLVLAAAAASLCGCGQSSDGGHQTTATAGRSATTAEGRSTGGTEIGSGGLSVSGGFTSVGGKSAESTPASGGSTVTTGGTQGHGGAQGSGGVVVSSSGGVVVGTIGNSAGGASGGGTTAKATGGAASRGGTAGSTGTRPSAGATGLGGVGAMGSTKPAGGSSIGGNASCTPPNPPTAKDSVTLDMGTAQGAPTYRASGFIYGISQDGSQPPNSTLADIKVTHLRCGGAQIGCPNGGYVNGQYAARWNAVKSYYAKAKAIGATLLVLVHDIWGADAVCKVPRWPGDGGDWTEYTKFVDQLITDFKAAGMTGKDVRWELWNEADYSGFWGGTQAQWLEMWKRGYQQIKAALPDAVIEGPSTAGGVGGWFTAFLDYIKANNVVPDYIGWHEAGGGDPVNDAKSATSALSSRGLTVPYLDVSEYGSSTDQNPGHSAWYLARFERAGVDGLRSNWGGGNGLYSTMGALVTSSWQPTGQYWIYKRYADQTGLRTSSTPGTNVDAVGYQDANTNRAIIVVGNNGGTTGSVNVVVKNMPSWLQSGGTTKVLLEKMPNGSSAVAAPTVVSSTAITVNCNALTVTIDWATATDGYAITLSPS
jgi:hypothetical protein